MAVTGYSGTPLIKKLGIGPESKLVLLNAPQNYSTMLEQDITAQICKKGEQPDIIHLFAEHYKMFEKYIQRAKQQMQPHTAIWVSWYKKSSGRATDITEDNIREYILNNGLVDIKVCAINELWSGLKCVVPVKLRGKEK